MLKSEVSPLSSHLESIRRRQIANMLAPPEGDGYFTDLGLFLYCIRGLKPEEEITLVECEFMGLVLKDGEFLITAKVEFVLESEPQKVRTKGYFFPHLDGDLLYDSVPGKGEPMTIKAKIPAHFIKQNQSDSLAVRLQRGRYGEEFLPLMTTDILVE